MILIRVRLKDTGKVLEICEGGRLTEHTLRNLFVEMHMRMDSEPGGEAIRFRMDEGEVGEIDPANIESIRFFRADEDITDEIVKKGEN